MPQTQVKARPRPGRTTLADPPTISSKIARIWFSESPTLTTAMTQQARNLLMNLEGHADGFKFLIRDRDAKFTAAFDAVLTAVGARIIKTPVLAPRVNAIAESWIASAAASAWTGC